MNELAKENSMLIEQAEATVAQLKMSKQEKEELQGKYDKEIEQANLRSEQLTERFVLLQALFIVLNDKYKHQIRLTQTNVSIMTNLSPYYFTSVILAFGICLHFILFEV